MCQQSLPDRQPAPQAQRERLQELAGVEAAAKRASEAEAMKFARKAAVQMQQVCAAVCS